MMAINLKEQEYELPNFPCIKIVLVIHGIMRVVWEHQKFNLRSSLFQKMRKNINMWPRVITQLIDMELDKCEKTKLQDASIERAKYQFKFFRGWNRAINWWCSKGLRLGNFIFYV